jgi:hypothetical protein
LTNRKGRRNEMSDASVRSAVPAIRENRTVLAQQTGMTTRQEFGAVETTRRGETAASVLAAGAAALIQARFIMAIQRPRDMDDVRARILRDCERPSFAESAWYRKPIGAGIEGLSIRFAEAALRTMGNVATEAITVYEDEMRRTVRVTLVDLETNTSHAKEVVIEKTVERKTLKEGMVILGHRQNSRGEMTHLVEAIDDEVSVKEGALVSKAIRTLGLRIIPGDIQAEAEAAILRTRRTKGAVDPDTERKKIADAFAGLGILPSALKEYLGKDLSQATPADLEGLRDLYRAIKAGEANFAEVLDELRRERAPEAPPEPEKAEAPAPRILPAEEPAFSPEMSREMDKALAAADGAPKADPAADAKRRAEARRSARREPGVEG